MTDRLDQLRAAAIASIKDAFPVEGPPTLEEMRNDHCSECSETASRFAGKRWDEITALDLVGNPPPSALTVPGFRYYLPCMMLRSVEAPVELDCLPQGVIGMLAPPKGTWDAPPPDRLRQLSARQVEAICDFLRFFAVREQTDWAPPDLPAESLADMPCSKVTRRAIAYWDAVRKGVLRT